VIEAVSKKTAKPIALASCYSDLANSALCRRAHAAGIPVIDGVHETLLAFKHLFDYHKFKQARHHQASPEVEFDEARIAAWKQKLAVRESKSVGETEALALLADFSLPVVHHQAATKKTELKTAAATLGYPLVLKTAEPGINHKSDSQGVFVGIQSEQDLMRHYDDLCNRLGPTVLVSQMIDAGVEVALGIVNDSQFGPVIMVAAGGILVELLSDRAVAMCPVNLQQADEMLSSLKVNRLLQGVRGSNASNRQALIEAIVCLSAFACEFKAEIAEIDINPVLVNESEAVAVDALILLKKNESAC
jgi:acyl-CoA synthetase (NDP forming)